MFIIYAKPPNRAFKRMLARPMDAMAMNLCRQLVGSESCWIIPGTIDCDGNSTL